MLYVNVDPKAFSLKYGVPLKNHNCHKCGISVEVNKPVICKDFVGFESEAHECGQAYVISLLKPRDKKLQEMLEY